jgi:hypothetical protein
LNSVARHQDPKGNGLKFLPIHHLSGTAQRVDLVDRVQDRGVMLAADLAADFRKRRRSAPAQPEFLSF